METHILTQRTADDLIYTRSELRDILLDAVDTGDCQVTVIKGHAQDINRCKYLFWIPEPGAFQEQVRTYLRRLRRLYDYLVDFGMELKHNQGLWMPGVADFEAGDRQINITASENWVSRKMSIDQLHNDIASLNRGEARAQLDRAAQSYSEFQICRRSGISYRVAIRNAKGERRTCGLNQYCVVLGAVQIVTKDPRYRKKRADAWRGVEEPLFKYIGREGPLWLVYPVNKRPGVGGGVTPGQ